MNMAAVIRTKNSGETLLECLSALRRQSILPEKIIVVDSGSSDNTLDILKSFNVTIIHYPGSNGHDYSRTLNLGIENAKTDLILNLSSHVILKHERLLEWMVKLLTKSDHVFGVSARHYIHAPADLKSFEDLRDRKSTRLNSSH